MTELEAAYRRGLAGHPEGCVCVDHENLRNLKAEVIHYQHKAQLSGDLAESYRVEIERLKAKIEKLAGIKPMSKRRAEAFKAWAEEYESRQFQGGGRETICGRMWTGACGWVHCAKKSGHRGNCRTKGGLIYRYGLAYVPVRWWHFWDDKWELCGWNFWLKPPIATTFQKSHRLSAGPPQEEGL